MTACDRAGNVTSVRSQGKVLIDLVAPAGKLTGVHVQPAEPEVGPMPRRVGENQELGVGNLLRSLLPALLNSPIFTTSLPELSFDDDAHDPGPNAVDAATLWMQAVTDTDVLKEPEPIIAPIVRPRKALAKMRLRDLMPAELAEAA